MLVSFQYVLYTAIIHKAGLYLSLYCIERGLSMAFLTVNAHNRMLDVSCHRNLQTTYLKALDEGVGASSRRLLLKFCFIVLTESDIQLGLNNSVMLTMGH
jgi:hypothetical protein